MSDEAKPLDLANVMENSVRVVMLRMSGLPGHRKVPAAKVTLDDKEVPEGTFSAPTLRLMPEEWSKKFAKVHGKAERMITGVSPDRPEDSDWSLPIGCHLIAGARQEDLDASIDQLITLELNPLRDEFIKAFPNIVETLRARVNNEAVWTQLVSKIPTQDQLKAKIRLKFEVLPFTFLNEVGRAVAEDLANGILTGISQTLLEETDKLTEKIKSNQTFKEGTFTELRRQMQILKDFEFLASEETIGAISALDGMLKDQKLVASINNDLKTAAKTFSGKLSGLVTSLTKEVKHDSAGRFQRRIKL